MTLCLMRDEELSLRAERSNLFWQCDSPWIVTRPFLGPEKASFLGGTGAYHIRRLFAENRTDYFGLQPRNDNSSFFIPHSSLSRKASQAS